MSSAKTVLIVDDDMHVLVALRKRLARAGYAVLTACTGEAALECARDAAPDAISLDVRLPGDFNGLDVASALQKDPRTARIPIIFVTGSADEDFKAKCKAAGGRYFIAKPYDSDLLIQTLRGIFAVDELAEVQRVSQAKRRQVV